jgi:hypothetical protein
MDLTNDELDLVLAGLFELTITYVEDDEKRERCKTLARKLGGDPEAMFFGAQERGKSPDPKRRVRSYERCCL